MRPMDMNKARPGLVLARTVKLPDGSVVVHEGTFLSRAIIDKLRALGVMEITVAGDLDEEFQETLQEEKGYEEKLGREALMRIQRRFQNTKGDPRMRIIEIKSKKYLSGHIDG